MHYQATLNFDGPAYDAEKDCARLSGQIEGVLLALKSGELRGRWMTVSEIRNYCHKILAEDYPEASISAQCRNLRKQKFGRWNVQSRYRKSARIFEYKIGN